MKFIALLRGINVGGNKRVEMSRLKTLFESLGYTNVSTYINSGNVIFSSSKTLKTISLEINQALKKEFGFEIPTLVKNKKSVEQVAKAIPHKWNNDNYKTDIAWLFPEIDDKEIIDKLPVKKEFMDIIYVKGAIIWNIDRKNLNKSQLNKLVGHKLYKFMTIRNVNTTLYLAKN